MAAALSQGVPFFHAGDEILRSKSLDRDSYDSGDWFNRLDYTFQTHNFGVGLPGREKNGDPVPVHRGFVSGRVAAPDAATIAQSAAHFREVLAIRKSTPLFRLTDAEEVQKRVTFYNTGVAQTPGVVVKRAARNSTACWCASTLARPPSRTRGWPRTWRARRCWRTRCRARSDDYLLGATCVGGTVVVPGHTACVFVEPR